MTPIPASISAMPPGSGTGLMLKAVVLGTVVM